VRGEPAPANAEVARIFREVAELLELQGANPFRVRAYVNAARVIEDLPDSIAELAHRDSARLDDVPGIGEDLAAKIVEIARTGTLRQLRELKRRAPRGAVDLMRVPGIGPRHARALSKELGVRSVAGLVRAARRHRIRDLRGFGAVSESRILQEASQRTSTDARVLRAVAAQYADEIQQHLRKLAGVQQVEVAGSFRRGRDTVGDLDVLVTCNDRPRVIAGFVGAPGVSQVVARGRTRATVRLRSGLQVDLRVLDERSYGAGLYYFTGSKAHNIAVRGRAREQGLKINEYGVFRGKRRIAGATETDVAGAVGLPWIPPELREGRGEIEAALTGTLPALLEARHVRGDLQVHTTDSDGRDSLEAMAEAAEAMGYAYLAVTDHSPALRMVRGLDRAGFRRQMQRIEKLNARLRSLTLLKGAEVDILADGRLDLDDDTLSALDIVLIAIHSRFTLGEAAQTKRIVRALRHPAVDILAHATGRLINKRVPMRANFDEVFRVAAGEGKMLEINAQPERLDLDDIAARAAIGHGVTLTLGTDAHSVDELAFMHWGVTQARRAWATKADVLNTRPLRDVLKRLHGHR
jgi:DNA polymerase (family 10)